MKYWFKRILALLVMIICVGVTIASVVGIFRVWTINESLTESLLTILAPVERSLERLEESTARVNSQVGATRDSLTNIETEIENRGQKVEDQDLFLLVMEEAVGEELVPVTDNLHQTVQGLDETITTIQDAVEAANTIPLVSIPVPELERLQQLSKTVAEIEVAVEALKGNLQDRKVEATENTVDHLTQPISRVDNGLDELQETLTPLEERLLEIKETTTWLKQQIPIWLDRLSIILTFMLLWLILSQVSLFIHAYYFFSGRQLMVKYGGTA
jgi:chromosome segregation ATPase